MKKSFKLISIIFVGALFLLTGCDNSNDVEKIIKAMSEIENGKAEVLLEMGMKSEDMSVNIDMNMDMTYTEDTTHTKGSMSFMGEKMEYEEYGIIKGNTRTSYMLNSTTGEWNKTEDNIEELTSDTDFSKYLENYKSFEKITDEDLDSGTKGYKITITKENALEMLESNGEDTFSDSIEITGDLILKVYVNKDYQMEKMVLDFTNFIKSTEEELEISKLVMTFKFKDFGKVSKITIPDEVLAAE